jgi:phosphoglucosamine mutase
MMKERGWPLGGENSGHIICLEKHTTGDGIVSALQVLAAVRLGEAPLAQLCSGLQLYPQMLKNVKVPRGFDWESVSPIAQAKREAERLLGRSGRVLLRPSGTEPVLRVMVEGADSGTVHRCVDLLTDAVMSAVPAS